MKKPILASGNTGKLREIQAILASIAKSALPGRANGLGAWEATTDDLLAPGQVALAIPRNLKTKWPSRPTS
jgi:hypothetical protein